MLDAPIEPDLSRRCRRAGRCPDHERLPIPGTDATVRVGALLETEDGLCRCCEQHVAQAVRELPMDYAELSTILATTSGNGMGERLTGTRERPIPIRVAVEAIMVAIDDEVQFWAGAIGPWDRRAAHHSRPGARIALGVGVLTRNWAAWLSAGFYEQPVWAGDGSPVIDPDGYWLTQSIDGLAGALHLLRQHELVKVIAGRTELVTRKSAPCPRCQTLTLIQSNGSLTVECARCGTRWTDQAYREMCWVIAESYA